MLSESRIEANRANAAFPTGPVERELFAQLIRAAWTVRRSRRLIAALGGARVDPFTDPKLLPTAERYEGYYRHSERAFDRILRRLDPFLHNTGYRALRPA